MTTDDLPNEHAIVGHICLHTGNTYPSRVPLKSEVPKTASAAAGVLKWGDRMAPGDGGRVR